MRKKTQLPLVVSLIDFHVPFFTPRLQQYMKTVLKENAENMVVIPDWPIPPSSKHPLTVGQRISCLHHTLDYGKLCHKWPLTVVSVPVTRDDDVWAAVLDVVIEREYENAPMVLVQLPEPWFDMYRTHGGKYKCKRLPASFGDMTASSKYLKFDPTMSAEDAYRLGAIHALQSQYSHVYPTVDIALITTDRKEIWLGRKSNECGLRFVGGFVDPLDKSLEYAARRELLEETRIILAPRDFHYVLSEEIQDWRYWAESDTIMTSLFVVAYDGSQGEPKAADDIAEIVKVPLNKDLFQRLVKEHYALFGGLLKWLEHSKEK